MKKFMKNCKRALVVVLAIALMGTSVDMSMLYAQAENEPGVVNDVSSGDVQKDVNGDVATEGSQAGSALGDVSSGDVQNGTGEDLEYYTLPEEEWYELPEAETSAIPMGFFSLADGVVSLKTTNEVEWIDRLDLSGDATVIKDFYNKLVEWTDNDSTEDWLITGETETYTLATVTGTVENASGMSLEEIGAAVSTKADALLTSYQNYVAAAVNAFDRDYPEVFWLTGGSSVSRSATYSTDGSYEISIQVLLCSDSYDMRATDYRSESAITSAISAMNTQVDTILADTTGMSDAEKITYFNDWLTKNNEYNTVVSKKDTTGATAPLSAWECVSALAGSEGSNGPVCEGYARALKVLCDEAGIPCVLVDGYAKNSTDDDGEAHMWNYVQVDGNWYGVDATWNDPVVTDAGGTYVSGKVSGEEGTNWLLVGSNTVIKEMTFIASHPVSNQVSSTGVAFTNGPVLSASKYVESKVVAEVTIESTTTPYEDIKSAMEAAGASAGSTLKLVKNVSLAEGYSTSGDFTLDLNGYTLDMGTYTMTVPTGATLTISDSSADSASGSTSIGTGKITSCVQAVAVINNSGTLKLMSGTIEATDAAESTDNYGIMNYGTLEMSGGLVTTNEWHGKGISNMPLGQATVTGGTIQGSTDAESGSTTAIGIANMGVLTVSGTPGIYGGTNAWGIDNWDGTLHLAGAPMIQGSKETADIRLGSGTVITIAGALNGSDSYSVCAYSLGVFAVPGSGYTISDTDAAKFTNVQGFDISKTGEGKLAFSHVHEDVTFDKVWDISGAGGEVTAGNYVLVVDVSYDESHSKPVTITGDVTLCLNGFIASNMQITVNQEASLTICDCSAEETGQIYGTITNSGSLILESGAIAASVDDSAVLMNAGATFTMNGGIIQNAAYGVNAAEGAVFAMNGGTIQKCTISGVLNAGSMTMSGAPTINGSEADILLGNGNVIVITGTLSSTDTYSVKIVDLAAQDTTDLTGVFAIGATTVGDIHTITEADAAKFTTANTAYEIKLDTTYNQLEIAQIPHEHAWSYSHPVVEGAEQKHILVAECNNTTPACDYEGAQWVELIVPGEFQYTGVGVWADLNNSIDNAVNDASVSDISYYVQNGTEWTAVDEAVNVGTYKAVATVTDGSAYTIEAEFEIIEISMSSVWVAAYNEVYDPFAEESEMPAVTVTLGTEITSASINYSTDGGNTWSPTVPTISSVGSLEVMVKVTAPNYADYTETVTAEMEAYDISGCAVGVEQSFNYYTGQQIKPAVTRITDSLGRELPLTAADYEVTYGDNTSVDELGTVSVKATNSNYTGTAQWSFGIGYYDGEVDILYNGAELSYTYYNTDVTISAEGYTVSKSIDGPYTDTVILSDEGEWTSMSVYFKQEGTGYITQAYTVSACIDKTAPTFAGENQGILVGDNCWNTLADEITYDVYLKERMGFINAFDADALSGVDMDKIYYYIDRSGSEQVKTAAELDACSFEQAIYYAAGEIHGGCFDIDLDGRCVIYAYAVDYAGNKSDYICSGGIVLDTKTPVVEASVPGEADGTLTDTGVTFTVEADEDATVFLQLLYNYSGEEVAFFTSTDIPEETFEVLEAVEADKQVEQDDPDMKILTILYKTKVMANQPKEITLTGLLPNTTYEYSVVVWDEAHNVAVVGEATETEGKYNLLSFTTLKTVPTFAANPTITGTYGDKLSEMTLSQPASTEGVPGTWSIADAGQMSDMPVVDGTTAYEVKFTPDDTDKYETVTVKVVPTVAKRALKVTVDNQTRKYGEENSELTYTITEGSIVDANYADRPKLTIDLSTTATRTSDAGAYDIIGTVSNDVNYDVTVKAGTLTIEQVDAVITVEAGKESYSQTFGDDSFSLSGITKNGDGILTYTVTDSKNAVGQSVAQDKVITVDANGRVTIVGAGTANIVMSMDETTNYKAAADVIITVTVAKAEYTTDIIERGYAYNKDNADSVDLTEYVPANMGSASFSVTQIGGDASFVAEPTVDAEGILTYTLKKGTKGQYATIDILVSSDNYEDFYVTVKPDMAYEALVELKTGSVVTAKGELTYGDTLGELEFNEAVFVEEGTETIVPGILSWEAPDMVPKVATTTANWIFTPTNTDYAPVRGTTAIKVNKATQPQFSIAAVTDGTYGQEGSIWFETIGGLEGAEITITVPENNGVVTAVNTNGLGEFFAVPVSAGKVIVTAVAVDPEGNYEDATATYELIVAPAALQDVSWAGDFAGVDTYTGNALTPAVKAYFIADGILEEGSDYTVEYVNNTNAYTLKEGDAGFDATKAPAAVVTGKGNFTGTVTLYFVINKAENAPNMPKDTRTVANSTAIAGQVSLPEGWIWQEPSLGLAEGSVTVAIAIYDGADKGNYVNEAVAVTITRLEAGIPFVAKINGVEVEEIENGWEHVSDDLNAAKAGDVIIVDMNSATVLPGDVIDDIKGENITVVLDMGNDVTWTINGKDITAETVADVNLQVDLNTANIPVDVINKVTGEIYTMQISLAHDGEFGYTAVLTINLKAENAGYYAQLFHYEENARALKFIVEKLIDTEGNAALPFTHASEYTIVIDDEQYKEPSSGGGSSGGNNGGGSGTPAPTPTPAPEAPSTPKSPQTGDTFPMEAMMLLMVAALAAVGLGNVYGRRKKVK